MLPILEYDLYKYLALAVMLLAFCDSFTRSKRLRYHDLSWLQVRFNSAQTLWV
jgi:hypothetical protein